MPDAPAYRTLFTVLEAQPVILDVIHRELSAEALKGMDALFMGGPRKRLGQAEIEAVSLWVERGGHLLLFAPHESTYRGQDMGCGHDPGGAHVLCQLVQGLTWIRRPASAQAGDAVVDVSGFLKRKAALTWPRGYAVELSARDAHGPNKATSTDGSAWTSPADQVRTRAMGNSPLQITHSIALDHEQRFLLLRIQHGRGAVCVFGSAMSFCDDYLEHGDNAALFGALVHAWLPPRVLEYELLRRQERPPRHRLLAGYPRPHVMPPMDGPRSADFYDDHCRNLGRPLILQVSPHPFGDPRTIGHGVRHSMPEDPVAPRARAVVERVIAEIQHITRMCPEMSERSVAGLHLGGGAPSLTPADGFRALCAALAGAFDLGAAEIAIESVPMASLASHQMQLDILQMILPAPQYVIRVRVQTFDRQKLERIGRTAAGHRKEIAAMIADAHARGMMVCGDFLYNLPGQGRERMLEDVRIADELGFDRICLHPLMDGLGTPWTPDPELLARLPHSSVAYRNWRVLRQELLGRGFVQSTITGFERGQALKEGKRVMHDAQRFAPEIYDMLGIGPSSMSLAASMSDAWAMKTVNHASAEDYVAAVDRLGHGRMLRFVYDRTDLRLLYLSSKLPLMEIDRMSYWKCFGSTLQEDFAGELEAIYDAELMDEDGLRYTLTPRGMFYADAIMGVLSWRQGLMHRTQRLIEVSRAVLASFAADEPPAGVELTSELTLV